MMMVSFIQLDIIIIISRGIVLIMHTYSVSVAAIHNIKFSILGRYINYETSSEKMIKLLRNTDLTVIAFMQRNIFVVIIFYRSF